MTAHAKEAWYEAPLTRKTIYSVIHNSIAPSKELCSKMALEEVGVSLPR